MMVRWFCRNVCNENGRRKTKKTTLALETLARTGNFRDEQAESLAASQSPKAWLRPGARQIVMIVIRKVCVA